MVIYLDLVIIQNIIVNYFLLYITARTIKVKVSVKRNLLASILGSTYVVVLIFPKLNFLSILPFKIIISFLMILMCFKTRELIILIKAEAIFILYTMLLAGLCFYMLLDRRNNNYKAIYEYIMVSMMIVYILIDRLVAYVKERKSLFNYIYDVEIVSGSISVKVKAFLDTGNELKEPATNLPVIIVEQNIFSLFKVKSSEIYYISYRTFDGGKGTVMGFKPDYVNIFDGMKNKKIEAIIALCENKLDKLNSYNALMSRGVIQ